MSNFHQNPNFTALQTPNFFNPFLQNPNAVNLPIQNPNMFNFQFPFLQQQLPQSQPSRANNEAVERANQAALKARRYLLAAGESLSTWKVSQAALMALQANSWESLGLRMQEIPSLQSLIVIEGKVNAFIHCFVAVRTICSLYDMELELCKNEAVEQFEELELGPLVRHPLVVHYFSLGSDVTETCKITSEEIISHLHKFKESLPGREVKVDEFLDYVAKKQSLTCKEKLNVRIQNLGMYDAYLKGARKSENKVLQKYLEKSNKEFGGKSKTRPLFSSLKKQMDGRFSALTDRIKSFSSVNTSSGKHIRFVSSSSEEEEDDSEAENTDNDDDYEDNNNVNEERNQSKGTSQSSKCSDRVSSCPYPSAIEEMTRLGFKSEINGSPCINSGSVRDNGSGPSKSKRKRKTEDVVQQENGKSDLSAVSDCLKKRAQYDDVPGKSLRSEGSPKIGKKQKIVSKNLVAKDLSVADDSMRLFVTTWKEACRGNDIEEVFERMLQFYKFTKKNKLKEFLSSYPFIGLLNVAVTSIKRGMWDSIYDSLFNISQQGTALSENREDCISIEVEQAGLPPPVSKEIAMSRKCGPTIGDIIEKISAFVGADDTMSSINSPKEKRVHVLQRLCKCEFWLIKQFSVEEFESLGFGEFLKFLERHIDLLPYELHKCLMGDAEEKLSLEARMQQLQLNVLISQASNSLWENESVSKVKISELLRKQFPLVSLQLVGNDSAVDYQNMTSEGRGSSNCVLFSATLLKMSYAGGVTTQNENSAPETIGMSQGINDTSKTKEAIEVLLRAPMLADLELWSHWNLIFAPSLGPLVEWLLKEVDTKELLCITTRGGKVIRIDHSASVQSFLEVLLRGSSFETALQLLSLFAVYGGEQNIPKSLLKCHIQRAFEVFIKNCMESEINDGHDGPMAEKPMCKQHISTKDAFTNLSTELYGNWSTVNKVVPVLARFILDCLSHLPLEFCSFAADVFLGASQSFIRDAPSAILVECKQIEQRLMLHEVGMSLGVVEWINDYKELGSLENSNTLISATASCLTTSSFELNPGSKFICGASKNQPPERKTIVSAEADTKAKNCKTSGMEGLPEVSKHAIADNNGWHQYPLDKSSNPNRVIETIRQEEFGLDTSLSDTERTMLKKQHARLGRALHCLSQELYSQDSHFLLELVQNADDNIYPEDVEPTICFILQEKGIVILNNEQGFSAENIRALCDVGNSTKKGHAAGYIGKKGIGFKSVFRITDAPEIHSNGFHIKFDITEGQIGFVLPTVIPPCDVDFYSRLVSADVNQVHLRCWNTCIILPFSIKQSGGFALNNIISMFSDLHPSLLLFLHRLKCITFRNLLSDTYVVMKREIGGDGLVKVFLGDKRMNWLVVSEKLQANVIRPDVQTTEISIAFTLEEIEGEYVPQLDQQPVFAFLPLRTYGLKFIIQGDFVLPSSREEVDGDSPWNQWLLSEFPRLFVSSETSFCNLACFRGHLGKAVTAFMSFVPLIGDVHGFFSSLPRMIISKLRMSNCLLLDGDKNEWVPPCKVVRNWTEQARGLLPDSLLSEHLGLGFLKKDIVLSDSLAKALGVEEYGPKILLQIFSSLCNSDGGLKSMGLGWLSAWLSAFHLMTLNTGPESNFISNLRKLPFVPLSDGTYGSVDEGVIWLHSEALTSQVDNEYCSGTFPKLYSQLRTVSPALFSAAATADISCFDTSMTENVTKMLLRVGVQKLSAHDIMTAHILPAISDDRIKPEDDNLMTEYLAFSMFHLYSTCVNCSLERERIITQLRTKALILTNHGYKRPAELPIHFSKEFGNPVDINKLTDGTGMVWYEVDITYLNHPLTRSIPGGISKWRTFLLELGVTDFVQIVQVNKNIANMPHNILKYLIRDQSLVLKDSIAKDWESDELINLLTNLSSRGDKEQCKYLLEVLDMLWDDDFGNKVTGSCDITSTGESKQFKSSFINMLNEFPWMVSSVDDELHYPRDLFHDCVGVRSILGHVAPYALPKVRSERLLKEIGLKTEVVLDDMLSVLRVWRKSETAFKASISQMSKFYNSIWFEMAASKKKVMEALLSGPFIFVPHVRGTLQEDVVPGALLSPGEVYWHDPTGSMDHMKVYHSEAAEGKTHYPSNKMLSDVYPALHDFFVSECGVLEIPPLRSYLQVLLHLSAVALPSQAAQTVFQIFLRWTDGLKSGSLSSEDVDFLKENLMKKEFAVLPTAQDKWVSLHSFYGLVCWSDKESLRKEFKHHDNIDFIYFGELYDGKEIFNTKFPVLMQKLGIPALSQVVTREAIYYGPADSSFRASLLNWALPYAQRYIYSVHPNEYSELKQSAFEKLKKLQIIVVEKLYYKNTVKKAEISAKKRNECNSLLQGDILYTTQESDSHSMFLELSRLFFGEPELHLANFLHMITTMVESGSTEEQTEFFILNSQKVAKIPDGELVWSLSSLSLARADNNIPGTNFVSSGAGEAENTESERRHVNIWPPANWRTTPGLCFTRERGFKTQRASDHGIGNGDVEENMPQTDPCDPTQIKGEAALESNQRTSMPVVIVEDSKVMEIPSESASHVNVALDAADLAAAPDGSKSMAANCIEREQLSFGIPNMQQAMLTGRMGEYVAYQYFVANVGATLVRWVNEATETGLPYDIMVGDDERSREYIEVKSTRSARKDWFNISTREWQFALEKGESFSIAHVVLSVNNVARVTLYRNPVKLCQLGKLHLAIVIPKQHESSSVS